ncbi:calpain 2, (m II) large subunit [Cichlidogyrus casuarinus]|uniref:Calpain 2, (M II) large subunit n=1 Tax=Cichlidogyrus casuarinus TaxID=1844966 RepID=A0ABD2QKZ9_9PLAT
MRSGYTKESLTNFSGGICETFNLREKAPEDLAEILKRAVESKSVMTCSIGKFSDTEDDVVKGLMASQAYSVTSFSKDLVTNKELVVNLIRVRNPWGDMNEWTGSWKDNGPEWNTLTETQKRELGYEYKADGEFWMDLKDFVKYFENLYVCHLDFKTLGLEMPKTKTFAPWHVISIHDSWRARINAGGSQRFSNTYHMNPQYKISIKTDAKNNVILGLLLKENKKKALRKSDISIYGYDIWKIVKPELENGKSYLQGQEKVASNSFDMKKQFQFSGRHVLSRGDYLY